MKDFTLSVKISLGFAMLLLIAAALGGMAAINMMSVEKGATKLSDVYVPEVEVGNNVERWSLLTMYDIRGYSLSEKEEFLTSGRESLKKVMAYLDDAKALAQKYDLSGLTELEAKARANATRYAALVDKTEELNKRMAGERVRMDAGAAAFMTSAKEYLAGQNKKMDQEMERNEPIAKLQQRHDKLIEINQVIDLGNNVRVHNFKSQALGEPAEMEKGLALFEGINKTLAAIRKVTSHAEDLQSLDLIEKSGTQYKEAMQTFLSAWLEMQKTNKERGTAADEVLAAAQETAKAAMAQTAKIAKESASDLGAATTTMIVGLIAALIIGISLALYLIRSITKPIIAAVQSIAEGTGQVVSASDQIAASATSLAEGATEQASSVEQVSATVEESTAINSQNSENAREADILAKGANEAAASGNHKVQELMGSMEEITEASQQIAKIIKTIDEIAFQTNLLALNAAVEAARAGEHGLGFAVVADEVKNLAGRSANAAKETADIIERAIEMIKKGNQTAKETNDAFGDILDKAKKTSDLISEIAVSVKEQSEGMNQIATAMGQVDQVTQQNAANSEEAAAASEELNAQAVAMMGSVQLVAKMVGLTIESDNRHHAYEGVGRPKAKKPAMIAHKPAMAKKPAAKPAPRKESDVFPLDEDDLKEF